MCFDVKASQKLTEIETLNRFNAQQNGHLLSEEKLPLSIYNTLVKRQVANDAKASAAQAGLERALTQPAHPDLQQLKLWIQKDVDATSTRLNGQREEEPSKAEGFLVKDVTKPSQVVLWHSALQGRWIISSSLGPRQSFGPWLKLRAALLDAAHDVWVTPAFQAAHPRLCHYLRRSVTACADSKWTVCWADEEAAAQRFRTKAKLSVLKVLATIAESKRKPSAVSDSMTFLQHVFKLCFPALLLSCHSILLMAS